jgi:hypothetical protein
MLGVLGYIVPHYFRLPGEIGGLPIADVPSGLDAITTLPLAGILQIVLFISIVENGIFPQKDPDDAGNIWGDLWVKYKDDGEKKQLVRTLLLPALSHVCPLIGAVLCCAVLCCAVLCCAVLCCAVLPLSCTGHQGAQQWPPCYALHHRPHCTLRACAHLSVPIAFCVRAQVQDKISDASFPLFGAFQ